MQADPETRCDLAACSACGVRAARTRAARAFTLVEMMVSVAVLALALSVVGVVFSVTTKTASKAAAYSEAQNWVRQFMLQLEEDLEYCEPSNSVLILVGRTQKAALTKDDLDAGKSYRVLTGNPADVPDSYDPGFDSGLNSEYSEPRTDLLSFVSNRPSYSVAPAFNPVNNYNAGGIKLAPIFVTYGHAAFADPRPVAGGYEFDDRTLRHIEQTVGSGHSRIPAGQWELARRAMIVEPERFQTTFRGDDRLWASRCVPNESAGRAGDVVRWNMTSFFDLLLQDEVAADAAYDVFSSKAGWARRIEELLYVDGSNDRNHHIATVLSETPVELRTNVGVRMLPGCAWFQVEFLMPEDPRNSLDYVPPATVGRYGVPLWTTVEEGETYIFVPDSLENRNVAVANRVSDFGQLRPLVSGESAAASRHIRTWPYAIRVTVRVWDPRGRLDEPIIRSVVHRFE